MCGRYAIFVGAERLKALFGAENAVFFAPRYNVAPQQDIPVVIHNRIGMARWGFTSSFDGKPLSNARSETVAQKAAFEESWRKGRRCLIPASGFYEWKGKQPYYVRNPDLPVIGFAGLWTREGDEVAVTILTRAAEGPMAKIHERMPVMLKPEQAREWFQGDYERAATLIRTSLGPSLKPYPVGTAVNKVANDGPELLEPVAPERTLFG